MLVFPRVSYASSAPPPAFPDIIVMLRAPIRRPPRNSNRGCPQDVSAASTRPRNPEVTRRDLGRAEVFDLAKPERSHPGDERLGFEVALEGFADGRDTGGERLVRGAALGLGQRIQRIDVVEDDLGAAR